jgi:ComF family protein
VCPTTLPRFVQVVRLGPYADPLRAIVRRLKYRRQEGMLLQLGQMLAQATVGRTEGRRFDAIVPVPMHWRRFSRGYDHTDVLARVLAAEVGLPVVRRLVRARHTPQQANLPKSRRDQNVRGAFQVRDGRTLACRSVLLVDDVITTGATANEAARTLLAAGVSAVVLAVLCKSEPPTAYAEHRA